MEEIDCALLIDDDSLHQFISKKFLLKTGRIKNIIICNDAKEAIDVLSNLEAENKSLPELILLDINMPVFDAWYFLDNYNIQKLKGKSELFILTSSPSIEDFTRAQNYGLLNHYILKPFTQDQIINVLDNLKIKK